MWVLSNNQNKGASKSSHFDFLTDEDAYVSSGGNLRIIIDGFILKRSNNHICESKDIEQLYKIEGNDFIEKIKGIYTLLIIENERFFVYSDHFAIKKYFYWIIDDQFIISNDLKAISNAVPLKLSKNGVSVYALKYHFSGGITAFENTRHNQPGEYILWENNRFSLHSYWNPNDLLHKKQRNSEIEDLVDSLKSATYSTLKVEEKISLSLTGGADTRNLLAIFLSLGKKPHTYTYGNPNSNDCIKASNIAKGLGLEHHVHNICMTAELFESTARRIIRLGGGLASIHRVHRLLAIEQERSYARYMYLGTLGGEFIKGTSNDDYIIPSIVYENWKTDKLTINHLREYQESKYLLPGNNNDELLEILNSSFLLSGSELTRKHAALYELTAHLHDAQDVNLYGTVMEGVYTPFLDIDYLDTLFSSQFSFNNKEEINNPLIRKIQNPVFSSHFLKAVYSPLLRFRYSGEHKPSEVLVNKYFAAAMKLGRTKMSRKYPANFPLDNWMHEFVKKNIYSCRDYSVLNEIFDFENLIGDFESMVHQPNESWWLKFTNPIMMKFLIDEYSGSTSKQSTGI
jgi:hypothetical protein